MVESTLVETLRTIERRERGESVVLNVLDAEECEARGWANKQSDGDYRLTVAGRQALRGAAGK